MSVRTVRCWPSSLERVLARLGQARPVDPSQTTWVAPCPAHADTKPSLYVSVGQDQRTLVHCYGGCSPEAVVAALGLTMADLMGDAPRRPTGRDRARLFDTTKETKGTKGTKEKTLVPLVPLKAQGKGGNEPPVFAGAAEALAAVESRWGGPSATWTYENAAGEPVGVIARWDRPDGKMIRPVSRRPGGWVIGGMPSPRPLYRLADVQARPSERVYVVEGEKAAEAGRRLGLLATTSAHGSSGADHTDWGPLAGREVAVLPDNDDAGREYARRVGAILLGLSPAAHVKIVDLPGLEAKGDLYDWIEARDAVESHDLRRQLDGLASRESYLAPREAYLASRNEQRDTSDEIRATANGQRATSDDQRATDEGGEAVLECLADIEPVQVRWLWDGRIALGRITVLVGRPGEGKSFLTTDMAARVTTGRPWPDGSAPVRGSVILICAEDDPGDTIRPRLDAHGADVTRVHLLKMVRRTDGDGRPCEALFTLEDRQALASALRRHPDCRLVIVDPIGSFLGSRADAHRDNDVRSVLAPVAALAEAHGAAVVVVAHRRKSGGAHADDLTLGSRAFTGIARAVWHLSRDPQDKGRRLLLPGKNNLAVEGAGLAFTITGNPPAIVWESDPVNLSADDALAEAGDATAGMARTEAVDWLRMVLSDGPTAAKDVFQRAEADGIATSTLKRAKSQLGVKSCKQGAGSDVTWYWKLPTD